MPSEPEASWLEWVWEDELSTYCVHRSAGETRTDGQMGRLASRGGWQVDSNPLSVSVLPGKKPSPNPLPSEPVVFLPAFVLKAYRCECFFLEHP